MFENHPHRSLADFRGKSVRCLAHDGPMTAFLASRGLELSAAKTRIVHIDDGFDFLGFNIRRFSNGKLLVRPQKEKLRDSGLRKSRCGSREWHLRR